MHPSTYINKVLFGSRQGGLQLWNLNSQKLVYSFDGWNSAVTVLEQAPAVDIAAIGLENGQIFVHNLKIDETLMTFRQEWGSVLGLSFRTDGPPIMVSAGPLGHVALWDLEKGKLATQMRSLHDGPITGCKFIQHEPLLVTTSLDNSAKVWVFDQSDESGRQLHEREGHFMPPLKVKFHGSRGYHILSAGLDSTLRCFSVLSERLNRNFGFASFNRKKAKKKGARRDENKMPPIVEFTTGNIILRSFLLCSSRKLRSPRFLSRLNVKKFSTALNRFLNSPLFSPSDVMPSYRTDARKGMGQYCRLPPAARHGDYLVV